jgi:hypothetical protein
MIPAHQFINLQLFRVRNKSTQVMFDPLPIFAVVKAGVASNAPELRR